MQLNGGERREKREIMQKKYLDLKYTEVKKSCGFYSLPVLM
jgi:hypothetical protein